MNIDDMSIADLRKKVDSGQTELVDAEVVTAEGENSKEAVKNKEYLKGIIDTLTETEVNLLVDYFAGKAEINYKSKSAADEAMHEWLGRMSPRLCIWCDKLMQDTKAKDKDKITVFKDLLLRIVPVKQEIILVNKNKNKTDYALLVDANKTITGIEKSFKKVGTRDVT